MLNTLNDELLYIVGVITAVLSGLCLATYFTGEWMATAIGYLIWLLLGASILFIYFDFPRQGGAKLPKHAYLTGLALVTSWLLWPFWAAKLNRQR